MTTVVRAASAVDIAVLVPLVAQYWEFERIPSFDAERVGAELARALGDGRLASAWIAFDGADAAGYLVAVYVFSLEHLGLTAEIDELFVPPAARERGVGKALLEAAEAEFVRRGCTNVSLQLGRENDSAREFYRAHGYRRRAGFELLDKMLRRR